MNDIGRLTTSTLTPTPSSSTSSDITANIMMSSSTTSHSTIFSKPLRSDNNVTTNKHNKMKQAFRRFLGGTNNNRTKDNNDTDDDDDQTVLRHHHRRRHHRHRETPQVTTGGVVIEPSSTLAAHEASINSILFHSQRNVVNQMDSDDHSSSDISYGYPTEEEELERELMERFSQQFMIDSLRFSFRDDDDGIDDNNISSKYHNQQQQHHDNDSKLQSCLDLLSSSDLDQNRLGLQRLNLLTKGRALSSLHRSEELASYAIVYGTSAPNKNKNDNEDEFYCYAGSSIEERLRFVFATFICDEPHDDSAMVNKSSFRNLPFLLRHGDGDDDDSDTSSLYYDDEDDDELNQDELNQDNNEIMNNEDDDFFLELDRLVELSDLTKQTEYVVTNQMDKDQTTVQPTQQQQQHLDESEDFSDYSSDTEGDDGDDDGITGKAWGALHNQALRVLANALTQISPSPYDARPHDTKEAQLESQLLRPHVPLGDTIWRNIIQTLVRNIRNNPNADITGYSLKIIRMLYTLHPDSVRPLLSQTLYPHLVYLAEYGQGHRFPVIHQEATALLKRAKGL